MVFRRKKRVVRRKRGHLSRKRPTRLNIRGPTAIADRTFVKQRYSTSIITASGLLPVSHIFQSSTFDPDLTGVGHQPLSRDQWVQFYNKYRVLGIGYEITAINTHATLQADVAIIQKPVTTAVTDHDTMWSNPYSQHRILGIESAGNGIYRFKGYMSVAKVFGVPRKRVRIDDVFQANENQSPARMCFLHLISSASDQSSALSVRWRVNLTYYVELFDRKSLAKS